MSTMVASVRQAYFIALCYAQILLLCLLLAILFSAFGVIYLKDVNRCLTGDLEMLLANKTQLQNQWRQLTLEEAAWSSQSYIEAIAQKKLGMELPSSQTLVAVDRA